MKTEIKDLVIQAVESGLIAKSDAELSFHSGEDDVEVEFELIASIKSIVINGQKQDLSN